MYFQKIYVYTGEYGGDDSSSREAYPKPGLNMGYIFKDKPTGLSAETIPLYDNFSSTDLRWNCLGPTDQCVSDAVEYYDKDNVLGNKGKLNGWIYKNQEADTVPLYFIKSFMEQVKETEIGNITIWMKKAIEQGDFKLSGNTRTRAIRIKS